MSQVPTPQEMSDIRNVVLVHSAKGGVGKSTLAAGLALACAAKGLRVGLLDADVYGPSVARLLGCTAPPEPNADGTKLIALEAHGIRFLSLANLSLPNAPAIWRGPMVSSVLKQFLGGVEWGPLDLLLIDMPPGTGDAVLTIAQTVILAGAVTVSAPAEVSLADTRKGLNALAKLGVPVLGLVENLSGFVCDECGERTALFGEGGGRATAERLGIPFLGRIPVTAGLAAACDAGEPGWATAPDGEAAAAIAEIARGMLDALDAAPAGRDRARS